MKFIHLLFISVFVLKVTVLASVEQASIEEENQHQRRHKSRYLFKGISLAPNLFRPECCGIPARQEVHVKLTDTGLFSIVTSAWQQSPDSTVHTCGNLDQSVDGGVQTLNFEWTLNGLYDLEDFFKSDADNEALLGQYIPVGLPGTKNISITAVPNNSVNWTTSVWLKRLVNSTDMWNVFYSQDLSNYNLTESECRGVLLVKDIKFKDNEFSVSE